MFLNAIRGLKKSVISLLVGIFFVVFGSISDRYKTQGTCDKVIYEDPFMLIYCLDRNKTQKMCNKAVDDCLGASKFIPDWFVTC